MFDYYTCSSNHLLATMYRHVYCLAEPLTHTHSIERYFHISPWRHYYYLHSRSAPQQFRRSHDSHFSQTYCRSGKRCLPNCWKEVVISERRNHSHANRNSWECVMKYEYWYGRRKWSNPGLSVYTEAKRDEGYFGRHHFAPILFHAARAAKHR